MDESKIIAILENSILASLESSMMHLQIANRRLMIVAMAAILLATLMFGSVMYFLTNYEITSEQVTVNSDKGSANYVGNDNNGEITNGPSDSQENNR